MASLTFNKEGGNWVAYFKAEADFALHLERDEAGVMSMEQSTTGGGYAVVEDFPARARYGRAFDYEFSALVYPKFIRIASATEPTYAEVISSGEVTELKFQEKAVEITANGTHTIAPDAGFAALNAVSVKVNVPTSGGGGSASSWRYFDFTAYSDGVLGFVELIHSLMHTMRIVTNGKDEVLPIGVTGAYNITEEFIKNVKAVGVDMSALVKNHPLAPNATTMAEVYSTELGGMTIEQGIADYWKLPEITEDEFLNKSFA